MSIISNSTNIAEQSSGLDSQSASGLSPLEVANQQGLMVWERCLAYIKTKIPQGDFQKWFAPIKGKSFAGGKLTILIPSQYFYEILESEFIEVLRMAIHNAAGVGTHLEYSIVVDQGNSQHTPITMQLPATTAKPNFTQRNPFQMKDSGKPMPESMLSFVNNSQLKENYTFDSYVEGDCNRLARNAGIAVAEKPGKNAFNPLMVYGGVGLGKTHLVQAIGNKIKELDASKNVFYVSTEKFTNQFIDCMKMGIIQEFTNFYMSADALILDDVHSLANKVQTQEIFFNIFNHLHQNGKQIILTSDRSPKDFKDFSDRLASRMRWGLTTDIQTPDFETRVAIIKKKMEGEGIYMPPDVVDYLAESVKNSIRELEGVLVSLIFEAGINGSEFNLSTAKQIVGKLINNFERKIDIDFIQKLVSEHFMIPVEELKSKTRRKEIVTARHVAMYFAKSCTEFSLKSIGDQFGGRDHTTVMHAVDQVNTNLKNDPKFKEIITELQKKLTNQ